MAAFGVEDAHMDKFVAVALVALPLAVGCGFDCEDDVLNLTADPEVGEFLYDNKCATCHGPDGTGVSGPSLLDIVPQRTSCDIIATVRDGPGAMPAFDRELDNRELADLLEFVTLEFQ
jgi:mono/diheme cytochrome c family protein